MYRMFDRERVGDVYPLDIFRVYHSSMTSEKTYLYADRDYLRPLIIIDEQIGNAERSNA